MKLPRALFYAALVGLTPLAACVNDGGYGVASWSSHSYSGWYDDYYGPFYDGYWGVNNYFYFRLSPDERRYRRDDRRHFHRSDTPPNSRYRRFEGTMGPPPQGTRMPSFPRRDDDRRRDRRQ